MIVRATSVIYPSTDLARDRVFWTAALGTEPYFDQPFYVGFRVGSPAPGESDGALELGLDPGAAAEGIDVPVVYWQVDDLAAATVALVDAGACTVGDARDVGVILQVLRDASGNLFGLAQAGEAPAGD